MAWAMIGGMMATASSLEAYLFSSRLLAGSFISRPRFHPPSIRPISSSFSDKSIYLFISIIFVSQPIWRKNFNTPSLAFALANLLIFSSSPSYEAENTNSMMLKNKESIFAPSAYRDVFGMCGTNSCQSLYAAMSFWITGKLFRRGGG